MIGVAQAGAFALWRGICDTIQRLQNLQLCLITVPILG
jgi:hypothetical protein